MKNVLIGAVLPVAAFIGALFYAPEASALSYAAPAQTYCDGYYVPCTYDYQYGYGYSYDPYAYAGYSYDPYQYSYGYSYDPYQQYSYGYNYPSTNYYTTPGMGYSYTAPGQSYGYTYGTSGSSYNGASWVYPYQSSGTFMYPDSSLLGFNLNPYNDQPYNGYGTTRSYPWGDWTNCYWGNGYGYSSCNYNPAQPLFDPWSGTWY